MKTLRDYQIIDKAAVLQAWTEYRSVLYQLPTGGGKSIILTSIINDFRNETIFVFAHKRKLIYQLKKHLKSIGIEAGILMGQDSENLDSNVIIVSIRTAVKDSRLEELLSRDPHKIIVDEARNTRTGSYDKVLQTLLDTHPHCKLLGVDATPYRKDKKRLDHHFQHLVVSSETIASLIDKGHLQAAKTIICPFDLERLAENVKETTGDYQQQLLSDYMRDPIYLEYAVTQYINFGENRQAIVFAVDKAHAKDIQSMFEDNGFAGKVMRIDSSMSEAAIQEAYKAFEDKKIQILINIEMITEGVDLPDAGCIVGLRPTKSLSLYLQIAGRGMRPDGVHDYFIILDCCGWTQEYGVVSSPKTWSLNPEIDPNSGRTGNKLFRRNEKNELVDDFTDYFGEVVELSPEEYLENLANGREQAENINQTVDQKIENVFKKIIELFKEVAAKLTALDGFDVTFEYRELRDLKIQWTHKMRDEDRSWSKNAFSLILRPDKDPEVQLSDTDTRRQYAYFETLKFAGQMGLKVLELVVENKTLPILELIEQIERLKKQKIDMDQFKKAEKKIAQEKRMQEIEDHVKEHGYFDLQDANWDVHFPKDRRYGALITKIELPAKKINNHHNTIMLHIKEYGRYDYQTNTQHWIDLVIEKNYVKGDRVLEIIESGKWNIAE